MSSIPVNAAFISIGIMMGALIISLIVAKICDHIHDRRSLRDDASDISEHTRGLIRARLVVMKFIKPKGRSPKEKEEKAKETAKKFFRVWSAKSAHSLVAQRKRAEAENKDIDGKSTAKAPSSITFVNEEAKANGGNSVATSGAKSKQGAHLAVPVLTVSDASLGEDEGTAKTGASTKDSSTASTTADPASTTSTSKKSPAKKTSAVAPAPATVVGAGTTAKTASQVKADQTAASKGKDDKAKEQKAKADKANEEKAKEQKAKEGKTKEEIAKVDKAKEDKAKEEKAKEEKAADNKGKENAAKEGVTTEEKGKEQATKGEATAAAGEAKGGKADGKVPTPAPSSGEPLKKITGRISPAKSAGGRGTPVKSPRASGISVAASVESQCASPQASP